MHFVCSFWGKVPKWVVDMHYQVILLGIEYLDPFPSRFRAAFVMEIALVALTYWLMCFLLILLDFKEIIDRTDHGFISDRLSSLCFSRFTTGWPAPEGGTAGLLLSLMAFVLWEPTWNDWRKYFSDLNCSANNMWVTYCSVYLYQLSL